MVAAVSTFMPGLFWVVIGLTPFFIGAFLQGVSTKLRPDKFISSTSWFLVLFAWWFFPLFTWFVREMGGMDNSGFTPGVFAITLVGCAFIALSLWAGYYFHPMEWWKGRKSSF